MIYKNSPRRMVENEAIARSRNESVQHGYEELREIAREDGQDDFVLEIDSPLHFYCECSNEKCNQRIQLTLEAYKKIHKQRDRFSIVCGHEIPEVEKVIRKEKEYCVVEKLQLPPENAQPIATKI